ncbi:immunoglobulin superfamily member 11-like [Latimeria chalumnae]|uniref:immunoglobulin superfamily member 11-like n=1 Tax=Latimeria chalumnae TaxID=7897 RepID=UPI00313E838B
MIFALVLFCNILQVIAYEQSQIVESLSQYTGRVGFAISPTKSATIFINNTQTSDTGTYQCMVNNPPDTSQPNIGVIGLTVLVPPSTPICSSQGRADEGGSITLSCKVEEGIPAPIFTWERMEPQRQTLVTLLEAEDNRGMAVLHNLSTETSGLYRCTAYNLLSSASCSVQLHVQIAPSSPSGIVVGVVVTLVMGLVLLALFVLVLWLHHNGVKKWSEDEGSYNDIRVDALSPNRLLPSRKACHEAGTASSTTRSFRTFSSPGSSKLNPLYNLSRMSSKEGQDGMGQPFPAGHLGKWGPTPSAPYEKPLGRRARFSESEDSLVRSGYEDDDDSPTSSKPGGIQPPQLLRMGAMPVMVSANSQAGFLV